MVVNVLLSCGLFASLPSSQVKSNAVRVLGNLLHFLRHSQMSRSVFQSPLEDAIRALIRTVLSEATMKVRWNACYALGNAFRNPALPLGELSFTRFLSLWEWFSSALKTAGHLVRFFLTESAPWSHDAFSALSHVVTSCENLKVRIKSAAALAVPAQRGCYGDTKRFGCVWRSLASALKDSENINDFLGYRYSTSLRHTLAEALLHLLSLSEEPDMVELGALLAGEEGRGIVEHLVKYLKEEGEGDDEAGGDRVHPQQRIGGLQRTLVRLKELKAGGRAEEEGKQVVLLFLEDLLKICEEC